MNPLVLIPARGGSKGVPQKNKRLLHDKPLIAYTIDAALKSVPKEAICISTDDPEIATIAKQMGLEVPFLRPAALASDTAGTYEVLLHAINFFKRKGSNYDTLILLQPTSPFRTEKHIKEAVTIYENTANLDMIVSVKITESNPYYVLFEENENGLLEKSKKGTFTRRQDVPNVYEYNGAIYIINIASLEKMQLSEFTKIKKYVMDDLASHDIDTMLDWKIAELLITENIDI